MISCHFFGTLPSLCHCSISDNGEIRKPKRLCQGTYGHRRCLWVSCCFNSTFTSCVIVYGHDFIWYSQWSCEIDWQAVFFISVLCEFVPYWLRKEFELASNRANPTRQSEQSGQKKVIANTCWESSVFQGLFQVLLNVLTHPYNCLVRQVLLSEGKTEA